MYLIVGLGNPGKEYDKTRHNIGYMMIDGIANSRNIKFNHNKKNKRHTPTLIQDIISLIPLS